MQEFLDNFPILGRGTFFCTQYFRALEGTGHELGPHPFLPEGGDWKRELKSMREKFPDAKGWRSHSCILSHLLSEWLAANGYSYASVHDLFGCRAPAPHRLPWGIWHVPIYYMDNMDFSAVRFWGRDRWRAFDTELLETSCGGEGVYVFDFHPIHLLLNTPNAEFYLERRDDFRRGALIEDLVYRGYGTASYFADLQDIMRKRSTKSMTIVTHTSYVTCKMNPPFILLGRW